MTFNLSRRFAGALTTAFLTAALTTRVVAQVEAPEDAIPDARAAALAWLEILDDRDFGASWDESAAVFKQAVGRGQWISQVSAVRAPFEPFDRRELSGAHYMETIPGAPPGPYVILEFSTAVSAGRTVTERIVPMLEDDGSWRVSGYYVIPQD